MEGGMWAGPDEVDVLGVVGDILKERGKVVGLMVVMMMVVKKETQGVGTSKTDEQESVVI